ncbi:helix-turn-helix domain-containing protein [Thermomonospora catenispora]|uniref:helix-turn-helix domain-containing protein n=1 Tax=Thermomonospora catenispora TaxID=2493090 RepID=UPI0011242D95|nr:helix-turn-helix domain-containing protein [Thermomonospora catenispora]TNY34553.1 hypothetical protein EIO00_23210 [Thermomonospora catenispora]
MAGRKKAADVVAEVQRRTEQAAALEQISGQERLDDPWRNPATRGLADELRDEQQRQALRAEHSRVQRRLRVADARAAEAERALEALALARQAASPARSVLALHTTKRTYLRLALGASVVLAAGSAMGVEATASAIGAPGGTGYIAEVGLTGLATAAITYRAHLAEHGGVVERGSWQSRVLWALMVVPLLVSVGCNLGTLNVVGALCSIGSAAFALLSCVIADRSAAAMQARAAEVTATDEHELRAVAMGEDLFTIPASPVREERDDDGGQEADQEVEQETGGEGEPPAAVDPVAVEADRGAAALEAWLADQDGGPDGGVAAVAPPDGRGPQGAERAEGADEGSMRPSMRTPGRIEGDQADRPDPAGGADRVLPAVQARRALGASTRQRIALYLEEHPGASVPEVAQALGLSKDTVKRHRRALRALRQEGGAQ